ncbi:hypothetical protein A2G96_13010 [Cupriavidus nantongensis]|uniref:Uncharacterized protein n=1 Tax=Cupriavidus nantongensis TaxID=1796606 RepID=A0A142JKH5_9BURK|nr:hypothetical protein A2G96_13010 [Cupriavidus nantongensis]
MHIGGVRNDVARRDRLALLRVVALELVCQFLCIISKAHNAANLARFWVTVHRAAQFESRAILAQRDSNICSERDGRALEIDLDRARTRLDTLGDCQEPENRIMNCRFVNQLIHLQILSRLRGHGEVLRRT